MIPKTLLVLPILSLSFQAHGKDPSWPPRLPDGAAIHSGTSPLLLTPTDTLRDGVAIAKTAPQVDFLYYDCQTYEPVKGLWSNWGDGLVVGDVYYSAIGDHDSPGGNAFVYAYDSRTKELKPLLDVRSILKKPDGHYTPGKIHSLIGQGKDGWLYFSTHRGSTRIAFDPNANYRGDWIMRHHPETGKSEIVASQPLEMQSLPMGMLDPERMIWYGGTADGLKEKEPQLLVYDLVKRKVIYSDERGPARAAILSGKTGKLYFSPSKRGEAELLRFDPKTPNTLTPIGASLGHRCTTAESSGGLVYTIDGDALWVFDCNTEKAKSLGPTAVGSKDYITSVDLDPKTERYLYYVPGAHGGAEKDGTPLVQYDLETNTRKVIAFLGDYLFENTGYLAQGTFSTAISPEGDKVYITWNGNSSSTAEDLASGKRIKWNACAMSVVHIPESERP